MEKAPKKYHTFGTVPKSRRKIVKRGKIDILTHKYMTGRSLFWLDTVTYFNKLFFTILIIY
jgi:hypothetical protein